MKPLKKTWEILAPSWGLLSPQEPMELSVDNKISILLQRGLDISHLVL